MVIWYKGTVRRGTQDGRTIGFPTVNLDPTVLGKVTKEGVYGSLVKIEDKTYLGALYFGPRLVKGETTRVLEINIFDFENDIYGVEITFGLLQFIRGVANFNSMLELKDQIAKDIADIKTLNPDFLT